MYYSDELTHYGILGMKWGIRRYQNPDGTLTPAGKKRYVKKEYHPDYVSAHSKKSIPEMSDAELRTRINRLNMETQYRKLTFDANHPGMAYVRNFLSILGLVSGTFNGVSNAAKAI